MLAIKTSFVFLDFVNTFISLSTAFLLGSLIGIEREYRRQVAGLRTNALVAVGAAIFVDIAMRGAGSDGGIRVAAAVVSGVGFLGAGAILRDSSGSSIRGSVSWAPGPFSVSVGVVYSAVGFPRPPLVPWCGGLPFLLRPDRRSLGKDFFYFAGQ